jgi:large subunit ribosomal protein L54
MTGLSTLKDQPDPVALPDDQYPDWLWTLLSDSASATKEADSSAEGASPSDFQTGAEFRQEKKRLRSV